MNGMFSVLDIPLFLKSTREWKSLIYVIVYFTKKKYSKNQKEEQS